MTLGALIIAALALGLSAVAVWVAVVSRADALTCRRELARHRQAHADQAEERRAGARAQRTVLRGTPPPSAPRVGVPGDARHADPEEQDGEPTGELAAQDAPTQMRPAVRLPRPGRNAQ